jgi:shikimate dehydrogenase
MANEELRQIYGVVGFPVKHSFSPAMHNAAFNSLKINAEYRLFEVSPDDLGSFFAGLRQNNVFGLNITIPYKERVVPLLDWVSEEASFIGAVNTVRLARERTEGFNTDGEGFIRHLREAMGFDPLKKSIAILGAGGAARAISVYLARSKAKHIIVYDIDQEKTQKFIVHLRDNFPGVDITGVNSQAGLLLAEINLLVNATPVGMKPSDPCLVRADEFHPGLCVYDLIYNPRETSLLKLAKEKGCKTANGLGMLLYQGMRSFEIWTGRGAPKEIMEQALIEALSKLEAYK